MRGENIEWLRLVSQFTGFGLWSMSIEPPLPPTDIKAIDRALSELGLAPDALALEFCARLRRELPPYLCLGPPAKFGEVGWLVDGVIVNHDTAVDWERLGALYRAGILDRESPSRLKAGSRILEIGAGYGALAYYIQRAVPGVRYTVLDIPESLVYSAIYLSVLNPDAATDFLPNYEFPKLVEDNQQFDLVINTLSMTEMSEQQVRTYCRGIRTLIGASGVFFEQNQDGRHVGLLNARDIVHAYFSREELLGGPGLTPYLTQGFATIWSNPAGSEDPPPVSTGVAPPASPHNSANLGGQTHMGVSIGELRSLHDTLAEDSRVRAFYDKFPRNVFWGADNRDLSTRLIREAPDTHELVRQMQKTHLFGVNLDLDFRTDSGQAAIEWLVRKYASCGIDVDSLPAEMEESLHSSPDISIFRAGRRLSVDFLRMVAVAHDIRRLIQQSRSPPRRGTGRRPRAPCAYPASIRGLTIAHHSGSSRELDLCLRLPDDQLSGRIGHIRLRPGAGGRHPANRLRFRVRPVLLR